MWIAKPLKLLSTQEVLEWEKLETHLPLAQTLCWARAAEAVSTPTYLVFSPDEKVGGLVMAIRRPTDSGYHFECINGPHLQWDNASTAPRQLATFAMAVSKLEYNSKTLSLKPRWLEQETDQRLGCLPIRPSHETQAATILVPVKEDPSEQERTFTPRLRRTLRRSSRSEAVTHWERLTPSLVDRFVPELHQFAISRGFTVPPVAWFKALTSERTRSSGPSFWLATSTKKENDLVLSISQIMICFIADRAHYLFGFEKRAAQCRASISTSALAHWEALNRCSKAGLRFYDLNGYVANSAPDHPYHGVCRFKEQFSGEMIRYRVPEFAIQF